MDAVKEGLKPAMAALERFILDPVNHDFLVLVKAMRNGIVYGTKVRFPHALVYGPLYILDIICPVMTFLFRGGTLSQKIRAILAATRQHATNLATFAFCYKTFMLFLHALPTRTPSPANMRSTALPATTRIFRKETSSDSFFSGLFAGYIVFGRGGASSVNQQIVIYVFARVCLGLAKLAISPPTPSHTGYQAGYSVRRGKGWGGLEMILGDDAAEVARKRIQKNAWPVFASVSWAVAMWMFRWYPDLLQPSMRSSMTYLYEDSEVWLGLNDYFLSLP